MVRFSKVQKPDILFALNKTNGTKHPKTELKLVPNCFYIQHQTSLEPVPYPKKYDKYNETSFFQFTNVGTVIFVRNSDAQKGLKSNENVRFSVIV